MVLTAYEQAKYKDFSFREMLLVAYAYRMTEPEFDYYICDRQNKYFNAREHRLKALNFTKQFLNKLFHYGRLKGYTLEQTH